MAFEIELKAWVEKYIFSNSGYRAGGGTVCEKLRNRLNTLGIYECAYEKDDVYYSGIRVRREKNASVDGRHSERVLVTWKVKEIRDGIEINDEKEFEVSDGKIFEELLERFDLRPESIKKKKGRAWNCAINGKEPVRAELSEVEGLGWFIELEIIAGDNSEKTVTEGRNRLLSLLDNMGIPRNSIESRTYTELLQDLEKSSVSEA
jgi:adenylate cyclase class 2